MNIKAKLFLIALFAVFCMAYSAQKNSAFAEFTLTWPVSSTTISSPMGHRNTGIPGASTCHKGCDIPMPEGSPVAAAISGSVTVKPNNGGAGNTIEIRSPDGAVMVKYFHLCCFNVSSGQSVNVGQQVGGVGNTGTGSGPHLHYELYLRAPGGNMQVVDPVSAQGQDLSDPAVVARLIEEGIQIITDPNVNGATSVGGALSGNGGGTYGAGYNIGASTGGASGGDMSCSAEILSTGQQLSEAHMNLETQQINEAIAPPANVAQMSCIDQFGEKFNRQIGAIFGNTLGDSLSGEGLALFNFGGIFTDTQDAINSQVNSMISQGLFGGRGLNLTQSITTAVTDAFNSMLGGLGGGGNADFACEAMNVLWDIMQCEGILDFKLPSLQELLGGGIDLSSMLEGLKPDSCAGQALYDSAVTAADRVFSSYFEGPSVLPSTIEGTLNQYQ